METDGEEDNNAATPDPCSSTTTTKCKKTKRDQKYKAEWAQKPEFSGWLAASKQGVSYAHCNCCNADISIKSGQVELRKHCRGKGHIKALHAVKMQKSVADEERWKARTTLDQKVTDGEIRLAAFVAEHNVAIRIMEHVPKLISAVCRDSDIAKSLQVSRTKTTAIITNVLGASAFESLCKLLTQTVFSIIIDESTDLSTTKHLCIVVRFLNLENKKVEDRFLGLLQVENTDAQSLFDQLIGFFETHGIPYRVYLIGFASDGANVMFGCNLSVLALLREELPHLFSMKCICHSFHLVASYACQKLPNDIEDLVRNIYNYLKTSPKRCGAFTKFQEFLLLKPHKMLHPSQTRWLSLEQVVLRILEQFEALKLFFIDAVANDNIPSANNILHALNQIETRLYLEFLGYVLPIFNNLNREMQSEHPKIHLLYDRVCSVIKTLLDCFIKPAYLNSTNLSEVNVKDPHNYLPLQELYLGANVSAILSEKSSLIHPTVLHTFRINCLNFYVEAVVQITKRFNLKNNIIEKLRVLDPKVATSGEVKSIVDLALKFPNLVPQTELQKLDSEWRMLRNCAQAKDFLNLSVEQFWFSIHEMKNGNNENYYPLVSKFMLSLLCLPHSSANVERIFSDVTLIKTKQRNRIGSETLTGLLHSKYHVENGQCFDFEIKPEMRKKMNVGMYKHKQTE